MKNMFSKLYSGDNYTSMGSFLEHNCYDLIKTGLKTIDDVSPKCKAHYKHC